MSEQPHYLNMPLGLYVIVDHHPDTKEITVRKLRVTTSDQWLWGAHFNVLDTLSIMYGTKNIPEEYTSAVYEAWLNE